MSKRLMVMALIATVVCFVSAAYAEVQNVKVGGDLTVLGFSRDNLNLRKSGDKVTEGLGVSGAASIARIKFDANLTDNVDVTIRLLNERIWDSSVETTTNGNDTSVNVDLAYVCLKDFLKDVIGVPMTLKLGRQNIKIGSGLLIADPDTNANSVGNFAGKVGDLSARKAFDGAVAVMDMNALTLTGVASKISETALLTSQDDVNLYAVDAAYKTGVLDTVLSLSYVLETRNKENSSLGDINVFDSRISSMPIANLALSAEFAYMMQKDASALGRSDRKTMDDYALTLGLNYTFVNVAMTPWFGLDYTRLSSNWNPMFEDMTPADIMNVLFFNKNVQLFGFTFGLKPVKDISAKLRIASARMLDNTVTTLPPAGITGIGNYTLDACKKGLGNEVDLALMYDYTSDVQFGLNLGYFKPGKAFIKAERGSVSQVVGSMKVSF
jgi:hypothetical protein